MRDVAVEIVSSGVPIILVLSAYNPVKWKIRGASSVHLVKVILSGYHTQDIEGLPPGVPIEAFTRATPLCSNCTRGAGYFYAHDQNTAEYSRAERKIRDLTGVQSVRFQGAYKANRFNVIGSHRPPTPSSPTESYVGRTFEDEVAIGGRDIALPAGRWQGLAYSRNSSSRGTDELAAFGLIDDGRLTDLLAVRLQTTRDAQGYASFRGCQTIDSYKRHVDANESFGRQLCYEVVHPEDAWKQPLLAATASKISAMGVTHSNVVVASSFHRADKSASIDVMLYAIPDSGLTSHAADWISSDWHPARLKSDRARAHFVDEQLSWADTWYQMLGLSNF